MTPFWIVNFAEKDSIESFFATYWKAYLQASEEVSDGNRPFYLTDATAPDMTIDALRHTAIRLSVSQGEQQRLIPCFNNQMHDLNVFFLGDITTEATLTRLHRWAAELRHSLLGQQWGSLTDVRFYALLWRPELVTVEPGVDQRQRAFLNELSSLETLDINNRAFHHVLFLQSSDAATQKQQAMQRLCLTTLMMARSCRTLFLTGDRDPYRDVSSTGVFYESKTQREHEAFKLGQVLMADLAHSTAPEFYDESEAQQYVDAQTDFLQSLSPASIGRAVKSGCMPKSGEVDIDSFADQMQPPISPLSFKVWRVWREYYGQYIPSLKRHLVNNLRRSLVSFEDDYRARLYEQQYQVVKDRSRVLSDLVFAMFTHSDDDTTFRRVSLPQSQAVLARFRTKIEACASNQEAHVSAFEVSDEAERCAQRAANNGWSAKRVLETLDGRLSTLPLFNFARLVRLLMLMLMLGFALHFVLPVFGVDQLIASWIGAGVALLLLLSDFLVFTNKVRRIEALKRQYIAASIVEMRGRLDEEIIKCERKTLDEMLQYADWLRTERLDRLQDGLSVLPPSPFLFHESPVLQPLAGSAVTDSDDRLLIPNAATATTVPQADSGSFGRHPLLKGAPFGMVNVDHEAVPIADLVDDNKRASQRLLRQLMTEQLQVEAGVVRDADFQRHKFQSANHRSMLLMLDVSGSMSGQSVDDLKAYVHTLSSEHEVEWIAFNTDVVATSRESDNVDRLQAGGGTNYLPAFRRAVEMMRTSLYDDLVLISDGCPFEPIDALLADAKLFNQPLNTISIGSSAEGVLVQLAEATGGEEITVESLAQVKDVWDNQLRGRLTSYGQRQYTFGELMRIVHIEAMARLLRDFALRSLASVGIDIATALRDYGQPEALAEWEEATCQLCTLSQTAFTSQTMLHLSLADTPPAAADYVEQRVQQRVALSLLDPQRGLSAAHEPDTLAVLAAIRPVETIGDLLWADFSTTDASLSPDFDALMQGHPIVNIYHNPLK